MTQGHADGGQTLWKRVNRPNLMVKIPATVEGLPAIMFAIEPALTSCHAESSRASGSWR